MTKHKSPKLLWKLSGYLFVTLLLAWDVHLNPGTTAGDVGPDRQHPAALSKNVHHYPGLDDITLGYEFTAINSNPLTTEAIGLGEFSGDSITTSQALCHLPCKSCAKYKLCITKQVKTQDKSRNCEAPWLKTTQNSEPGPHSVGLLG